MLSESTNPQDKMGIIISGRSVDLRLWNLGRALALALVALVPVLWLALVAGRCVRVPIPIFDPLLVDVGASIDLHARVRRAKSIVRVAPRTIREL
jgi:hypothetical protein